MLHIESKSIRSFNIGQNDNKTNYCKVISFSRNESDDVSKIYNESFYVDIFKDDDTVKRVVECFLNNGFVSAIPVMTGDQRENHETCIKFRVNQCSRNYYNMFKDLISSELSAKNDLFVKILNYIDEVLSDFFKDEEVIDDKVYYVNLKDSVFNAHRCGLLIGDDFPIFECCGNIDLNKQTDIQLNFGTKVTGYIGATYQECPVSFDKYLMVQIPGSGSVLRMNAYNVSYLGSIFTPELFEDYSKFRFALDIRFLPLNKTFVSNSESYEYFNEMISQSKEANESKMWESYCPKRLSCKMNRIKLVVSGADSKKEDSVEILTKFVETITNFDVFNSNIVDINTFKSFVSEHTVYDNVNYVFEADVDDLFKNIIFNVTTW